MIHLRQAIVVEGKYDKIRLAPLVDAPILVTGGFRIFKDREQLALLRRLARQDGLLILTDSDTAGFRIRNYIKSAVPEGKIFHAYIPEILGKEPRKDRPSKEGTLGVEGVSLQVLAAALEKSGVLFAEGPKKDPVTRMDLYEAGLSGGPDSRKKRLDLLRELKLPRYLSTAALLEALNALMDREGFFELLKRLTDSPKQED
jgi:ribonuclease M5